MKNKIDVIYLMAGSGERAKLKYPKQFYRLGGKPIFIHALEKLKKFDELQTIIIACQSDMIQNINIDLKSYGIESNKMVHLIEGGKTRQESVFNALKLVITKEVLIMESVRPFVEVELIDKIINTTGNVVPIDKSYASVYNPCNFILDRDTTGTVQLPQKFYSYDLIQAHKKAIETKELFHDDSTLLKKMLNPLMKVFHGPQKNIKITTPLDLVLAEAIYKSKFGGKNE